LSHYALDIEAGVNPTIDRHTRFAALTAQSEAELECT
jgi:hypothetical protein